jgi:GMP synthase-like glutamine amidotransferase
MTKIHAVLVVNCSRDENLLNIREFVWPIQRALNVPSKVIHLRALSEKSAKPFDAIIFSGCQLLDDEYLKYVKKLSWLKHAGKPLLGVCAGQHLLSVVFGGKVLDMKHPCVGVHAVHVRKNRAFLDGDHPTLNVYGLHSHTITLPSEFASAAHSSQNRNEVIFHVKQPIAGVSFHPEVLNKGLFSTFLAWAEDHPAGQK